MINYFRLGINKLSIHYDTEYGIDKRTGWSIAWDGCFIVEFEKHLIIAIYKAIKNR